MTRRGFLGFLTSGMASAVAGCGGLFSKTYRFRMTVEVDTPQGLKTGSSVMEVSAYKSLKLTSEEKRGGGGLRGEAVTVELPSGPMFVLLSKCSGCQPPLGEQVTRVLSPGAAIRNVDEYVAAVSKLGGVSRKADLPRVDWPLMVRFRDPGDPKTVELASSEILSVKRIIVETTNDDVTTGIEKRLTWLRSQHGSLIPRMSTPDPTRPPIGATINKMDFSTELHRGE